MLSYMWITNVKSFFHYQKKQLVRQWEIVLCLFSIFSSHKHTIFLRKQTGIEPTVYSFFYFCLRIRIWVTVFCFPTHRFPLWNQSWVQKTVYFFHSLHIIALLAIKIEFMKPVYLLFLNMPTREFVRGIFVK